MAQFGKLNVGTFSRGRWDGTKFGNHVGTGHRDGIIIPKADYLL
jgi:hypothetical protein